MLTRTPWETGRERWPGIELPEEVFNAHVGPLGLSTTELEQRAAELYVACACVAKVERAIPTFSQHYLTDLRPALGTLLRGRGEDFIDEVRQLVSSRLFVGTDSDPPRIGKYAGRGPLDAWIRMVVVRCALDLTRRDDRKGEPFQLDERTVGDVDGELAFLKDRYSEQFTAAFRRALHTVSAESKMLLRLHYVDQLSTAGLAKMHGVSRATMVRRLAQAREEVLLEVANTMRSTLHASDSEYQSLLGIVRSQMGATLSGLLENER